MGPTPSYLESLENIGIGEVDENRMPEDGDSALDFVKYGDKVFNHMLNMDEDSFSISDNTKAEILESVLANYKMYAMDKRYLRHTDKIFHRIFLKKDFKPVKLRPYPLNIRDKIDLESQIKELLDINIIKRTTSSEWCSPVLLVDKIDSISKRMVLDTRGLNEMTVSETFFNPTINEIMGSLHGAKVSVVWT